VKTDSVNLRGLLFDFDGLLVDTETPSRRAFEDLYRRHGHELPLDKWATLVGTIGAEFEPYDHLETLTGTTLDRTELDEWRRAREYELVDLEDLRPGVADLLDEADDLGLSKAIVSSSDNSWIERHLGRLDRAGGWDVILAANGDVARAKPAPTLYLEALELLGLRADEAVAFEDSPNGVAAAKAAGLFTVAVPNPITQSLALDEADLLVESFEQLSLDDLIQRV
jgi:putative hydrolase of the HAD superfamily